MRPVTNLAQYRAIRQRPMTNLFRWHEAFEQVTMTHIRILCAMQRSFIRLFLR